MTTDWVEHSFGEVTENYDSRRIPIKASKRKSGPYPYYGASGVVDHVHDYIFDGEYLLIAEDGANLLTRSLPVAFMASGKFWVNNHAHIVAGNRKADTTFLCYKLAQTDISGYVTGSAQPKLSQASLNAIRLLLPPPSEQRAIASVLGALDDKIEQNRRTAIVLERLARALFRSWFVDFEPVYAKASGTTSFPAMPQEVFDTLPVEVKASTLGDKPSGWELMPLDQAVDVNPTRRLAKGTMAPYLAMAQMPTKTHAPDGWIMREVGGGAKFMNGDTLVARITPCLENGKTAFVDFLDDGEIAWGSTEYIVLRPKAPTPEVWAYLLARTPEFRAFAIQNMSGTSGRQRVPYDALSKFHVAIAPPEIMKAFGDIVDPLFRRSSAAMRESAKLAEMRDALLPELLSGRIRLAGGAGA